MRDSFKASAGSVLDNSTRSILTISIIATGIMALVGIETSIEILSQRIAGSMAKMGASAYTITSKEGCPPLRYADAAHFVRMADGELVSVHATPLAAVQVKSEAEATDPTVSVIAADDHYLEVRMAGVASGRGISGSDVEAAAYVAVLGDNVRKRLFGEDGFPEGKTVVVSGAEYSVVGYLQRQGAVFAGGLDNSVIVPVTNARGLFLTDSDPVDVTVVPSPEVDFMESVAGARAAMRAARRLRPTDKLDFDIVKSDSAQSNFASLKSKLSLVALGIGIITLLGAAVGLMNIMLVSVKERTREIGVRKALGAKRSTIERQFLGEAVIIGQLGCAVGVVLGLLAGNIVAIVMDGGFAVPWQWVGVSIVLALAVSLLSGFLPARRAAALDPVRALASL